MIEFSFFQLVGVIGSIMDFCEKQNFTKNELMRLRVRLSEPQSNGEISFDLGIPRS